MFTGIIEEIGHIKSITRGPDWIKLSIQASKVLNGVKLGDSIAVNGTCLTVTSFSESTFSVDVMPETLKSTSLSQLKTGSPVNLERAMAAGDRFGGHFVTGHVDGTGRIVSKTALGNAVVFHIETSQSLLKQMIPRGSVSVDGISLTIGSTDEKGFKISIIPHTLSETVLKYKTTNDIVNLETDIIGKYIDSFIHHRFQKDKKDTGETNQLSKSFLEENGFM